MYPDFYGRAAPGPRRRSVARWIRALIRARTLAGLVALVAAIMFSTVLLPGHADASGKHWLACENPDIKLPRTVVIEPGVDAGIVRAAIAEWNALWPGTFVEVSGTADVRIVPSARTWVDMPCTKSTAVVYAGSDVNLSYWMAHELGHTLGLADHIKETSNPSNYINPGFCPADGYTGIMSYCTNRVGWWSADDREMMAGIFGQQQVKPEPTAVPPTPVPAAPKVYPYKVIAGGIGRSSAGP